MSRAAVPLTPIARHVWETKYRYTRDGQVVDADIVATWQRVATAVASVERDPGRWRPRFFRLLHGFRFLPGGRILAGAGTGRRVTLFNCFVMGVIEDSMEGIFDALKEGALTMQQGGGVGYDFSTLRPHGTRARRSGTIASGPVSFLRVWDDVCATLLSTGTRRGAMMGTLRCDHPDIEAFIDAKRTPGTLTHFNLSVLVTDAFMAAVARDEEWPLVFPAAVLDGAGGELVQRDWPGQAGPVPCRVLRRVRARDLWRHIMRANYESAEPGVLFIDRIIRENNLAYRERIVATNPCGEIPLPPYGACCLGSFNLTRFVRDPFTPDARFDHAELARWVPLAVRLLDNVIDLSGFPLPAQREQARGSRRLGLGMTGLADALVMLGLHYASAAARDTAVRILRTLLLTAYRSSVALAREKGSFPFYRRDGYLRSPFIRRLPAALQAAIARHGTRNSHLLALAPTGSISLLANNVSSGIEPIFDLRYRRRVVQPDGGEREFAVEDHAYALWRARFGEQAALPLTFVTALELSPHDHLAMQAALQRWVDNAVSKTVNVPEDYPFDEFTGIYRQAWRLGLKGCTTYRPHAGLGAVLESSKAVCRSCGA